MITEDRRLAALARYRVMCTDPEPGFDALAQVAARVCDAPLALITFLDAERQWFKARVGTDLEGSDRASALCDVVVRQRAEVLVPDLTADPRFAANPYVTGDLALRAYAGVPLTAPDGEVVGTLCVLDQEPRHLTAGQAQSLRDLASAVMALLEGRREASDALDRQRDARRDQELELLLEASEARFRAGFEHSPVGKALLADDLRFLEVNAGLCRSLAATPEDLVGRPVEDVVVAEDVALVRRQLAAAQQGRGGVWQGEVRCRALDGRTVTARLSVVRLAHPLGGARFLVQVQDVTEHRAAQDRLAQSALRDPLTALPNRAALAQHAAAALERAAVTGRPVGVLSCDLDGFTLVNDGLGQAAGDEALKQAAARLRAGLRHGDLVARTGGDEFVVVCEDSDAEAVERLARRLERAFRRPLPVRGDEVLVTVSLGLAVHDPASGAGDLDALLHDADAAMQRAKHLGKDRHTVFDAALRSEAESRRRTEALLRRRLDEGGLQVHHQPVVDLATGRVVGTEALCRLVDDEGRSVPPSLFIDVAESRGLVDRLGLQVLRQAAAQGARWNADGHPDLHVAVNASARQAGRPDFADEVLAVLAATGLAARNLVLELTESVLIEASTTTVRQLSVLRDAGVRVAIDDFGTRYASLRYVQHLPVSVLKVDMSFTRGLPDGRQERAIVSSVAHLAHALDLECVAEGIETPAQREHLRALGVLGQGYLLGRPTPAQEVDLTPRPVVP